MIQVALSELVVEKLQAVADREGSELTDVLAEAVEQYIARTPPVIEKEDEAEVSVFSTARQTTRSDIPRWLEKRQQIQIEQRAYEKQHKQILSKYAGQYIAMYHGEVVDTDADDASLSLRIRARFGNTPVLITPVLDEPIQTIYWRRVRMGTTNEK